MEFNWAELVSAIVYSLLGVVVFACVFVLTVKAAPFNVIKEIEEDHNTALAIVIGSVIIGVAIVISAAISG